MEDKVRKVFAVEAIFDYMFLTCLVLHEELFYNSLMVSYPKLIIKFPYKANDDIINIDAKPLKEDRDLKSLLKHLRVTKDQMFESIVVIQKKKFDEYEIGDIKKELEKKADALLKNHDRFKEIDVKDKESFFKVNDYFFMMECIFNKIKAGIKNENWKPLASMGLRNDAVQHLCSCIFQAHDLTLKYSALISHWTGRMANRGTNPGAERMKEIAKDNENIIKDVLSFLQIREINIFRKDKRLRETFVAMTKKKSGCTSEDRIFKIARSLLNVKALP